ncbi:hypothetical protein DKX15_21905, partial [Enterococcus faecium]
AVLGRGHDLGRGLARGILARGHVGAGRARGHAVARGRGQRRGGGDQRQDGTEGQGQFHGGFLANRVEALSPPPATAA